MFSITEQTATLAHINVRTEQHGDKPTGAVDLKFHFTGSNGFLAEYHQALRSVFYKAEESPEQAGIPGLDPDALTVRRFGDLIETISVKQPLKGADVVIGFGLGGASDIKLETVDVVGHKVSLMEGGSCRYEFTVKGTPTSDQVKKLFDVLGGEVDLTVIPAADKQGSLGLGSNED